MKTVIFLSGPPKAGKSRLRGDLYRKLVKSGGKSWFVQAFSPDMEGQWMNDCIEMGFEAEATALARNAKNKVKESGAFFSPRFVAAMQQQLQGLIRAFDLVVADLGGLPSPQNADIISAGLEQDVRVIAVVLSNDQGDGGWKEFWASFFGMVQVVSTKYHVNLADDILSQI